MRTMSLATICMLQMPAVATAQIVEVQTQRPGVQDASVDPDIELFGRGLLDVHSTGQLEASAQIVKIRIGEPESFSLPLYLLTGATKSTFGDANDAESAILDLVAPTGGFLNASSRLYLRIYNSASNITRLKLTGTASGRLLSARAQGSNDLTILGAAYADAGFFFQTGAWVEDGSYEQGGVFWVQFAYATSIASLNKLRELFGAMAELPNGLRADLGVLIKDRVNAKVGAFLPQKGRDLPGLRNAPLRFAIDYSVR